MRKIQDGMAEKQSTEHDLAHLTLCYCFYCCGDPRLSVEKSWDAREFAFPASGTCTQLCSPNQEGGEVSLGISTT